MFRFRAAWCLAAAVLAAGCLPNRVGLSPDGRTMYFSLGPDGPFGGHSDRANIYSLQIETLQMQALTDGAGLNTWCALVDDGKTLVYMEVAEKEGFGIVHALRLEDGVDVSLAGLLQPLTYPWPIPGKEGGLLAAAPGAQQKPYWVFHDERGLVALPLPEGAKAVLGNVGLARNRFAVAVSKETKLPADAQDAEKDGQEYQVFVVDLAAAPVAEGKKGADAEAKGEVKATAVARWVVEKEPVVDLAFSEDGSRLVAAVLEEPTVFYELDVTGQAEPKWLFECPKAYYPQVAAGGGIVYLRTNAADEKWREVALWTPGAAEALVLARLPGKLGEAYTTWRWMEDGRLRVYHLSNEGVRIVETSADGSAAKGKRLSGEHLVALARMADFKRASSKIPSLAEGKWPADVAGPIGVVADYFKKQEEGTEETRKAWEAAQAAAAVWEEVPAVTEIKAPAAEAPAEEKPAEAPQAAP